MDYHSFKLDVCEADFQNSDVFLISQWPSLTDRHTWPSVALYFDSCCEGDSEFNFLLHFHRELLLNPHDSILESATEVQQITYFLHHEYLFTIIAHFIVLTHDCYSAFYESISHISIAPFLKLQNSTIFTDDEFFLRPIFSGSWRLKSHTKRRDTCVSLELGLI